jgi:hypothetical protein
MSIELTSHFFLVQFFYYDTNKTDTNILQELFNKLSIQLWMVR